MIPERPTLDDPEWVDFADHLARYLFAMGYVANKSVLVAGSGPGYGASLLKAGGARSVQGVDIDPQSIQKANERFSALGITFFTDDCEQLTQVQCPIDVVCSFENIEHLAQPQRFLAAAGKLLAPGGVLLISTPDRAATPPFVNGRPSNPYHHHEWYAAEFNELLAKYFGSVVLKSQVKSVSLVRRSEATRALIGYLKRTNPLARAVGALSYLATKKSYWRDIRALAAPAISDYPIVDSTIASLLGSPWCHYAICTNPLGAVVS